MSKKNQPNGIEAEATDASAFMDALRAQCEQEDTRPPEIRALDIAFKALKEIQYAAAAGSLNLCRIEVEDAVAKIEDFDLEMFREKEVGPSHAPKILIVTDDEK